MAKSSIDSDSRAVGLSPMDLLNALKDGSITHKDLLALEKESEEIMKRKDIVKIYEDKIKYLVNQDQWYIRLDGKQIRRHTKEEVLDELYRRLYTEEPTLSNLFNKYLKMRKLTVSSNTLTKDIHLFESYIKDSELAKIPLRKIKHCDGYDFMDYCLKVSPNMRRKYWNNIKTLLNQMFQYAMDNELMDRNPFTHLKPSRDLFDDTVITEEKDMVFTPEEQTAICLQAYEDAQKTKSALPLAVVLLFYFGMRDGELLALKWSDIIKVKGRNYLNIQREMVMDTDDENKACGTKVVNHTKTNAGLRKLPISDAAMKVLEDIKELNRKNNIPTEEDDFIFQRNYHGEITTCTSRCVEPRLKKYCDHTNQVKKSPHDVRRTVITNLYLSGMPLRDIQKFAGHADVSMTMQYIKSMPGTDNWEHIEALDPLKIAE